MLLSSPTSYPTFQHFQQHQQALRESCRPISNVQSQHDMYYPPSHIVCHPPAPIQQVFNISNSTVTFNLNELQQEAKRQRTCTSRLSEFKSCEHTHFDHLLRSATLLHFMTMEYITSNIYHRL